MVQDEVENSLAPASIKPTETQQRSTYAAVTRRSRIPAQRLPTQLRKTNLWQTVDNKPDCFHCGHPGHVVRYCREKKAIFYTY
ncbi:CCHC-type domain-containing protein [Trichonephila clavipes]|nr:CCHC-type domain-containing protein [Trichonephila clavipes]